MQQEARIPFFDNAKAILMALVVLGHFAECGIEESRALKTLFIFVYAFHMPAFFFVSGIFVKLKSLSARSAIQKALSCVAVGFMLKFALFALEHLLNWSPSPFSLLSDSNIPWFMFSLAAFQLLAWLFKTSNPITILACSICLSLFVGYDESIGDYLYLSRTIVFFPFFWVGAMLSPEDFEKLTCSKIAKWGGGPRNFGIRNALHLCAWRRLRLSRAFYREEPICSGRNRSMRLDQSPDCIRDIRLRGTCLPVPNS